MRDLIVIEDSTIQMMLSDQRYLTAFPCLAKTAATMQKFKPGCGVCQRKVKTSRTKAMLIAKRCLASLPGSKKTELKKLLGARQIRIIVVKENGTTAKYTY
jgi:hypothetical protein